jgi:hypothetical protein
MEDNHIDDGIRLRNPLRGFDRVITVDIGGASMTVPTAEWCWRLRYVRREPARGTVADDRMLAASVNDSFRYLLLECSQKEAWRRIKLMRAALNEFELGPTLAGRPAKRPSIPETSSD